MNHQFNIEHAAKYGVHAAIILNHLQFWISKNAANEKHFYDGRTWTCCTAQAMTKLFPYMTERQIRYALQTLLDAGVLLKGNYSENHFDRGSWFAFNDESALLLLSPQFTNLSDGRDTIVRSDLTNLSDQKIDNIDYRDSDSPSSSSPNSFSAIKYLLARKVEKRIAEEWLKCRKTKKLTNTQTAFERVEDEARKAGLSLNDALHRAVAEGWGGFKASWLASPASRSLFDLPTNNTVPAWER